MRVTEKITAKQLIYIFVISRIILALTFLPVINSPPKNQDTWIGAVVGYPIFLLIAAPIYFLWKKYPNQTIIQYCQTIAGRMGTLLGVLYVWFFIHITALNILNVTEFFTSVQMVETPSLFFVLSLVAFTGYAALKGLEVIGRLSEFLFPILMVIIILLSSLLIKEMDLDNLMPILEKGFFPILFGGVITSVRTPEILVLAMLLPYLNVPSKTKSVLLIGFLLMSLLALIITLTVLMTFGFKHAQNLNYPYFEAIQIISLGDFLEHIESIHLSITVLGIFLKVSLFYYLSVLSLAQLLKLPDYRMLILPMGTLIAVLCPVIGYQTTELSEFLSYKMFPWYAALFVIVIPALLLLLSFFRKKGESHQ